MKVPVAVNACVIPAGIDVLDAWTAIDATVSCFTASVAEPDLGPKAAVIVVEPAFKAVARPRLSMVTTFGLAEVQLTELVRVCLLPSLNLPVAWTCCFVPAANGGGGRTTVIDVRDTEVTVIFLEPETDPSVALIVDDPCASAKIRPEVLTLMTVGAEELQFTEFEMFWLVPSLNFPVAVNCSVIPCARVACWTVI